MFTVVEKQEKPTNFMYGGMDFTLQTHNHCRFTYELMIETICAALDGAEYLVNIFDVDKSSVVITALHLTFSLCLC